MLKGIVIAFGCFLLFLAIHVIIFHYRRVKKPFHGISIIFWSVVPVYALVYLLTPGWMVHSTSLKIIDLLNGLLIYLFLFFGYCYFYFIVERSLSVRIMIELENSPEKRLTFEQLKRVYSLDALLSRRLEMMKQQAYIVENSGHYVNTSKANLRARVIEWTKNFLRLGLGG